MNRRNILKAFISAACSPIIPIPVSPPMETAPYTLHITRATVSAGTRRLKANWTMDAENDLMTLYERQQILRANMGNSLTSETTISVV